MNLRIDAIFNHGDVTTEHVAMTVTGETNLKWYIVTDTTYKSGGGISDVFRHTKWLPAAQVYPGERVALWTGTGSYSKRVQGGVTWHHCYWNSHAPIWNDDGDAAILFQVNAWKTTSTR